MPIEFEWHSELPVLIATYHGDLNSEDCKAAAAQRSTYLQDRVDGFVCVADLRSYTGSAADCLLPAEASVLAEDRLICLLLVVSEAFYRVVTRATARQGVETNYVQFCRSIDDALERATLALNNAT